MITYGGLIRTLSLTFNFAGSTTLIFGVTFLVFIGAGGELSTQKVFTTLALFNVLCRTNIIYAVRCFFQMYEASVGVQRIQVGYIVTIILIIIQLYNDSMFTHIGKSTISLSVLIYCTHFFITCTHFLAPGFINCTHFVALG